ncbi:MAG: hypothetical protein ACPHL6_11240, partial [Rubripirellula sp.]
MSRYLVILRLHELLLFISLTLLAVGCSETDSSPETEDEPIVKANPSVLVDETISEVASDDLVSIAESKQDDQDASPVAFEGDDRFGDLFEEVIPILEETRGLVDQHGDLPDKSRLPFTEDKQSNSAAINELLDAAIVVLADSDVTDYRQRIREANDAISLSYGNIADY